MDIDFAKYEADCARTRKENEKLLYGFAEYLEESGLKEKTIAKHCLNVDSFLDCFLLYYDAVDAAAGIDMVNEYLGDFFIRKCMWSTPAQTKQTITSLKKFYTYMAGIGKVTPEKLENLRWEIKTFSDDWIEAVRAYNEPNADDWF